MKERYSAGSKILSAVFLVLCAVWIMPVFEVVINSFKANEFVSLDPFALPNAESFVGFANYIKGMTFGNYPAVLLHVCMVHRPGAERFR